MPHINLGIPEDLLAEIDEARGSIPRTTWIRESVKQRLGASILHQQMAEVEAIANAPRYIDEMGRIAVDVDAAVAPLRGGPVKVVDPAVPMPPEVKAAVTSQYKVSVDDCKHAYRSPQGKCFACGDER